MPKKHASAAKEPAAPLTPEEVCARIREAILRGELKPGEKLAEIALAERFSVSRTPVREAIRQLEVEGLAVRTRYLGATVRQLTPADILDLLDLREVLEGLVAGNANKNIAFDLGISPRTVEIYRANLMTKMAANSLSDLVRMAMMAGILDGGKK